MGLTLGATFIIVFREALEAGLIVGIIFTILSKLNAKQYYKHVFISIGLAIVASLLVAWGLLAITSQVRGEYEKVLEGVVSLIACCVVSYMVLWMRNQARTLKSKFEADITQAVSNKDLWFMISMPFIAIFREGAETVLFLQALSFQGTEGSLSMAWLGGWLGLGAGIMATYLIWASGTKISLKPFFQLTSILLIFIAGGLLAYGIHELEEAGWISGIIYPIWNINHILNEKEGIGAMMKALFGYNGNPSLLEFCSYISYLGLSFYLLFQPVRAKAVPSKDDQPPMKLKKVESSNASLILDNNS